MTPRRILFVCTGNICRSATAEIMARRRISERKLSVEVVSAGVAADPGRGCPPETLAALRKMGLDGGAHRAQVLTPALVEGADLILAMTEGHRMSMFFRFPGSIEKVKLFKSYAGLAGDVEDPYGEDAGAHDACAAEISQAVDKILDIAEEETK